MVAKKSSKKAPTKKASEKAAPAKKSPTKVAKADQEPKEALRAEIEAATADGSPELPEPPQKPAPVSPAKAGEETWGGKVVPQQEKTRLVSPKAKDVILPPKGWNSRQPGPGDEKWLEIPVDYTSAHPDAKLLLEMKERVERGESPNHTPVKYLEREDGKFVLVFGFRRHKLVMHLDPELPLMGTVVRVPKGSSASDVDATARLENLSENMQRQGLRPWELAEAVTSLKAEHADMKDETIAKTVGKSTSYVRNLIRMRKKLHPDLWAMYQARGEEIRLDDLVAVCVLPSGEQVEAFNARQKKPGRPAGATDGEPRTRHTRGELDDAGDLAATSAEVDTWTTTAQGWSDKTNREQRAFAAGAFHVLQALRGSEDGFSLTKAYSAFKARETEKVAAE